MFINLFNYEKEQNKNIVCTWSITYIMNEKQGEIRNSRFASVLPDQHYIK